SDLVLLVPTNVVLDDAEPAVAENFERSLQALQARGAKIRRERFEPYDAVIAMTAEFGPLIAAEAYTDYHAIADGEDGTRIDRRVLARMLRGKRMSARDVLAIQRRQAELIPESDRILDGALLVM